MPFLFEVLRIPEVMLVKPRVFGDVRGFNLETFKRGDFQAAGMPGTFVQANHSRSSRGVLRGLHYQKMPRAQGKLVTAITGEVFDVAVDIRVGSPTYGEWVGQMLTAENHHLLYVPPGFAHGFCVLSEWADFVYLLTGEYSPEHERGILWNDPDIGIEWPVDAPELSARDIAQPRLGDADNNFVYTDPLGPRGRAGEGDHGQ